ALRAQLPAPVEHDVVLERLRVQPLGADLIQLLHERPAVAEDELQFDFLGHRFVFRVPCSVTRALSPRPKGPGHGPRNTDYAFSTSTPGRLAPAMNSSEAPPPVEMWVMRSAKPDAFTASTDSPPPTTLIASASATARAMAIVPFANSSFSNTPIGPFQKIVFAPFSSAVNAATVFEPMSNAFASSVSPSATSISS